MDNRIKVGDIHIIGLTDGIATFNPRILFPNTPLEAWEPYYDIFPECFDGKFFRTNLGSFAINTKDKVIVADTGLGPHGDMFGSPAPGRLLGDFESNEISLESVNTVFITHLHGDHYGWNYREDTEDRKPTFPNAEYIVHTKDWEHWTSDSMKSDDPDDPLARSVLPLFDDGLLKLIEGQTQIGRGVDAIHTPGHTPGHMSLIISSGKERALLIGDIVGSPMQVTESEFFYTPDSDSELGRKTRNDMLDLAEKENMTVLGSHLSYPGWGTIIRWEGRRYFQPLKNIKERLIN